MEVPTLVVDSEGVTAPSRHVPSATEGSTVPPQQQQQEGSAENMCKACHHSPIEYMSSACSHPLFCRKCAMKCATGGKCKVCGTLFPDLRHI